MFGDFPDEWREWIALTPLERWRESQKIFAQYLAQRGSLDPDPDPMRLPLPNKPSPTGRLTFTT
jgi:hypothetical protein